MAEVILKDAYKRFGETEVIHGINLHIQQGKLCVFVGPSGCGKSTLLRMIAGLERLSEGKITIGDQDVTDRDPAKREVAMVFQSYALYPHMSVRENMGFGLRMNGVKKATINTKVNEAARILQLEQYLHRKPGALSGGQRQRVAIGRAIVRGPKVFLFDEPLSNLDAELRVQMRLEIARLHQTLGATMVYVTHDQVEAMTLADTIVVLRQGKIEQVGTPMELYQNPANMFVAGFIGSPAMNFIQAFAHKGKISCQLLTRSTLSSHYDGNVMIGIRPEHIQIQKPTKQTQSLQVSLIEKLGNLSYIHAIYNNHTQETTPTNDASTTQDSHKLVIEQRGNTDVRVGDTIAIRCASAHRLFFNTQDTKRIV